MLTRDPGPISHPISYVPLLSFHPCDKNEILHLPTAYKPEAPRNQSCYHFMIQIPHFLGTQKIIIKMDLLNKIYLIILHNEIQIILILIF